MKIFFFLLCSALGAGVGLPLDAWAQVIVEKTVIRAPFEGTVSEKTEAETLPAPAATSRWNNGETRPATTRAEAVFDGTRVLPIKLQDAPARAQLPVARAQVRAVDVLVGAPLLAQAVVGRAFAVRGGRAAVVPGEVAAERTSAGPSEPPATLRWNNGETLTGGIDGASETDLAWKTPLFEEPLALAWSALHRIDEASPDSAPSGAFAFTLRDGSHLYGDLTGISADGVTLHSTRHGDVTLRRSEVLRAQRMHGPHLLYAGPQGEAGWGTPPAEANRRNSNGTAETLGGVPPQGTGTGGSLALPFFDRTAFLKVALPNRVDAEFRVSAKERPAFSFALEGAKGRLRVETWGDQLVLAAGDGFTLIRPLDAADRSVALRVCWSALTRHCKVYTPEGRLLTEWTAPAESGENPAGVSLQNRGRDLALEFLRLREWDGQRVDEQPDTEAGQPRVETDDGEVTLGSPSAVEDGALIVPLATDEGAAASFPLDTVDAVVFSGDAPHTDGKETTLSFADGTFLRGQIAGIKDGDAELKTRFAEALLPAKTGALRQIFIRTSAPAGTPPEPPLKQWDKIAMDDVTLHGTLVADGEAQPRWLPVGGTRAATPSRTLPNEITRVLGPEQTAPGQTSLFYTRMGDALPGTLHGMDRREVEFDSPIVERKTLPGDELAAVQFDVATGGVIHGFDAAGWQVIRGNKEEIQKGDSLSLADGSVVAYPSAMQNGEVRFHYDTTNFSSVRLRMFCDGTDPAAGTSYVLFRMNNSMSTGVEPADGQFSNSNRVNLKTGPIAVRLVIDEKGVQCFLNDTLAETVPLPAAKRAGSGLIIEPMALWGNAVQTVELAGFSAVSEPGQAFLPAVNADAKAQALTVPRFRKDDPPRQALLAANGDLLRGEIEAITNTQFGFRTGLEELHVPRDRVRAVVTLQKPTDKAPPTPEEDAVSKVLARKMEQRFRYSRANLRSLINVVERTAPELKFKLPENTDNRSVQFQFEEATVEDTLQSICELFGLHYRLEKDVVVIGEKPAATSAEMVRTAYWLKPGALSENDPAEKVLSAKGVPFPGGASVRWQDSSQCLEMVNTPENQAKLVAVLGQDFGGVLGSPTHWLRLRNGGKLGLTVEAFGPAVITGTHPIYGRCTVPLAEVYAIRNTLPEPTAASRTVGGWQLVYAPEPVLPESGGEGSALLGKEAPTFKLKMLGGGEDFDLSKEKGHVVVLDFWATWCGPCVRALPGMIEAMGQFPADRVKFVGLNQAEAPEQVKRFLETRGWKLTVAMDAGQNVARQYGVDGIPHTVIVGPDGKVAWVKTGYTEDGDQQAAAEVKKLLGAGAGGPSAEGKGLRGDGAEVVARK